MCLWVLAAKRCRKSVGNTFWIPEALFNFCTAIASEPACVCLNLRLVKIFLVTSSSDVPSWWTIAVGTSMWLPLQWHQCWDNTFFTTYKSVILEGDVVWSTSFWRLRESSLFWWQTNEFSPFRAIEVQTFTVIDPGVFLFGRILSCRILFHSPNPVDSLLFPQIFLNQILFCQIISGRVGLVGSGEVKPVGWSGRIVLYRVNMGQV